MFNSHRFLEQRVPQRLKEATPERWCVWFGRMIAGDNIYDPYSAYGPHGRHNRECTCDELRRLLEHAGFAIDVDFTSDVHPSQVHLYQVRFVRARNDGSAHPKKPSRLYRNYPPAELAS